MFRNIKVFWKFALVAILILLVVLMTAGIALVNSNGLKYEYDNLYGFMLIPIMNLDEGNLARADLTDDLFRLTRPDLPADQFAALAAKAQEDDKAMAAMIERYETEWVTTTSPEFTATLVRLGKQDLQTRELELLKKFHSVYTSYAAKRDNLLSGKDTDYAAIQADMAQFHEIFHQLVDVNKQFADLSNQSAQAVINRMRFQIILVGIFACLLAIGFTYFISRDITIPLNRVVQMIMEMGKGHLGGRLQMDRKDEIGALASTMDTFAGDLQNNVIGGLRKIAYGNTELQIVAKDAEDEISPALLQTVESLRALNMATDFAASVARGDIPQPITETYLGNFETLKNNLNALSDWLRQMLNAISSSAADLSQSAAEILAATTQQASGASEQSASIAQTTTTVDEVKTIGEQAIIRAQEVVEASNLTVEISRNGRRALGETIASMATIKDRVEGIAQNILVLSEQTQQIGEIISTVSELAAQSNMLALNASVEAARAGEHGKGFAVVAAEVRSLAEQSRQATAQIKAIIEDIQKATNLTVMATEEGSKVVDQGVHLAAQTQAAIEQLSTVINESAQRATQV
ncbi:MAG: methyl-accepting chemotaxis protein, partial [Chloroflexi bacterium]